MKIIRYEYPGLNDFNQVFGSVFPALSRLGNTCEGSCTTGSRAVSPAVSLYEDADHYYAKVELPGIRKEDIKLELENDVLTVTAKRVEKTKDGETTTDFATRLPVPEDVDTAKVDAAYADGLLTLTLTKQEARKPRQIDVR
jgi:HSP20 family protein